jgi:origin recognition complex subunit 1
VYLKNRVLVLDEVDYLISRSQKELYTLVDWPSKPKSRLIVIGIANTLDLPERLLMPRIASRFGTEGEKPISLFTVLNFN